MTLGQNGVLRYSHFSDFFLSIFGDRMANLGLIDFKINLYIGQMPLWHKNINFGITWPFFVQF